MKKEIKKIDLNFQHSIIKYSYSHKSKHWAYMHRKKKKLLNVNYLENFRNNNLSYGLDDQFYKKKEFLKNFIDLKKECGEDYLKKTLPKKNIGKIKNFIKFKKYFFVDKHDIFFVKYLHDLEKNLNFKKIKLICEIGSGYGALTSKIIKRYNKKKIILIDLPESNILSSYFLKANHPEKKIFYSYQIKDNKITKADLKKYDIFILNPWDQFLIKNVDLFINTRSMMEMNYDTIKKYFKLIQSKLSKQGYFLNINRYYKDTTGYPIEYHKYPYDNKWKVIFSKTSWKQPYVHTMLTQRVKKDLNEINNEMHKIKKIMKNVIKKDPRMFRRFLHPDFYKLYKYIKNIFI